MILGAVLSVVLPLEAGAQVPTTSPEPASPISRPAEPKWRIEGAFITGMPRGELDQENMSAGLGVFVGRTLARNVSVFGGFRYINVSTDRKYGFSRYDLRHYEVPIGVRYSIPVLPSINVFGEAHLSWAMFTIGHPEFGGDPVSPSGSGAGLRAGFAALVADQLGLGAAVGYSYAAIEVRSSNLGMSFGGDDRKLGDAWLTIDVSAYLAF